MDDSISIYLDDGPIRLYRGMKVKHALISKEDALYQAACRGELDVVDEHGFRVGLDGAVREGMRLFTRRTK